MSGPTQTQDNPLRQEVCFLFNKNYKEVVMIKMKKPAWGKGLFNGPGGKRKLGESGIDCVVREVKEEINIDIDKSILVLRGKIRIPHWDTTWPSTLEIGVWCGILGDEDFNSIKGNNSAIGLLNDDLPFIYPVYVFDRDCSVENVPLILQFLSSYENTKDAPFFMMDYKTTATQNEIQPKTE